MDHCPVELTEVKSLKQKAPDLGGPNALFRYINCCVTEGKSLNLSESKLSYLNVGKIYSYFSGSLEGQSVVTFKKPDVE